MSLKDDIRNKVNNIVDDNFTVTDITYVPRLDNSKLTFGNTGLKFTATTLFIDMRGSTKVLNSHNKTTVAKIHMSYFHAIVKIANANNGHVRSFNGDSALVFFQGNSKNSISDAVITAMKIKYMLADTNNGINSILSKYSEIDFGIGIDYGDVVCTKVGAGGDHNCDLFWVGNCVNRSTVISNMSRSPKNIGISKNVYDNLLDYSKYGTEKTIFGDMKVDMWSSEFFEYNGNFEFVYNTAWHSPVL